MKFTYQIDRIGSDVHGYRLQDGVEGTRCLFINEQEHGYGSTNVFNNFTLPDGALNGFDFFEYQKGDTGTYHRVKVADIVLGEPIPDPEPLAVRHAAWPGRDATEITLDLRRQRDRAVAKAIANAKARKKHADEERARREREAEMEQELAAKLDKQEGSVADEIARKLAEMGLSDYGA